MLEGVSMSVKAGYVCVVLVGVCVTATTLGQAAGTAPPAPPPAAVPALPSTPPPQEDMARPPRLPALSKWMLDPSGTPAHWLGEVYRRKRLREPINVIIVDPNAASADDAVQRLLAACEKAGYPARRGHSSGYFGFVNGSFYPQLPAVQDHAFSNEPFEVDNNHGRVFGPARLPDASEVGAVSGYLFSAAFSRETVDPFTKVKHRYGSFNRARDDFAQRMDAHTAYKITGFLSLDNALISDPTTTTGDHDGVAVLLTAVK
jgi:hypothetical protein